MTVQIILEHKQINQTVIKSILAFINNKTKNMYNGHTDGQKTIKIIW